MDKPSSSTLPWNCIFEYLIRSKHRDKQSESTLQWHWIIEYIASVKEISFSLLQEWIDFAPVKFADYPQNVKELIAMRCLEELFPSTSPSTLDSTIRFEFSRSCRSVLKQILDEVPLSILTTAEAELLKWDVNPFITHKRATKRKCYLDKLKEAMDKGTLPPTDRLKKRRRLSQSNQAHTVGVKDGGNSTYAKDTGENNNRETLSGRSLEDSHNRCPASNLCQTSGQNDESTEQKCCMKCNEAGQLLACKTSTCSSLMHKNCLDASVQLNAEGTFVCPICAYSHAVSELVEAQNIATLAMKDLVIFIWKGID